MTYFILWVVFLLGVILSVPIAAWLEKRKLRAAYGPSDDLPEDDDAAPELNEEAEAEPEVMEAEENVEAAVAGEGDAFAEFAEFEEIK